MEAYTKLGVMDFDQTLDSPNEYKNNLDSPFSSPESGYESVRQSLSSSENSSIENSQEYDSLSSEDRSLTTVNNYCASSSQEDEVISTNIERMDCHNYMLQPEHNKYTNENCCKGKQNSTEQVPTPKYPRVDNVPIQEVGGGVCRNISRTYSSDIEVETAISIDEKWMMTNGDDYVDSSNPRVPISNVPRGAQDTTKIRCPCKRQPPLYTSKLKHSAMDTAWLVLQTHLYGHFISECSHEFLQRFELRLGDRLISVNEEEVHGLSHQDIVQKMGDLVHMGTDQTLVIERHSHRECDEECFDFCIYEIQLEILEKDGGNTFIDVTSRLFLRLVRKFSVVYNLESDGKRKCWISHYTNGSEQYLCPGTGNQEALALGHLTSIEDPKFQFSRCQYHGFRRDGNQNTLLFLLTLMSKDTDGFVSVGRKGNVRLKRYDYETDQMTSIANPIPYIFICRLNEDNSYNLESLNHEGWFLRWNRTEKKMDIQELDEDAYQPEFLFKIYTDASRVRSLVHQ